MSNNPWRCTCSPKIRKIGYHSGDCPWFIKNQKDGHQDVTIELSQPDALALLELLETNRKVLVPDFPVVIGELRAVLNLGNTSVNGPVDPNDDAGAEKGGQVVTDAVVFERRTQKGRRQVLCDACGKFATVKSSERGAVIGNHRDRFNVACRSSMGLVRDVAKRARP
jgi:ribosomal protein L30/L7E